VRKALFLLLGLLTAPWWVDAQIGMIVDEDGWTNLRATPNWKADILWRIPEDIIFWYDDDAYEADSVWIEVVIPADTLSPGPPTVYPEEELVAGYVHRSRIRDLYNLAPYTGKDFSFKYILEEFDPTGRTIDYYGENLVKTIDHRSPWGTDGSMPKIAVQSVKVQLEGKELLVPQYCFADLFECSYDVEIVRVKDLFFVHQWNSDGAGGYQLTWVFSEKGLERRIVLVP
jgi:hypothetical protein